MKDNREKHTMTNYMYYFSWEKTHTHEAFKQDICKHHLRSKFQCHYLLTSVEGSKTILRGTFMDALLFTYNYTLCTKWIKIQAHWY